MKTCTKCGEAKPLDQYSRKAASKDGLRTACKACASADYRKYYGQNTGTMRDRSQRYRGEHRDAVLASSRRWKDKTGYASSGHHAAYYAANRDLCRERYKLWAAVNRGAVNAHAAKRRAARKQRTVPWADAVAIATFYEMAARVSRCLGVKHHVDHILPLRGKTVSGLHVPLNLRVVPAVVNLRKGNRA